MTFHANCWACGSYFKHHEGCPRVLERQRLWTPPKPGSLRAKIHDHLVRLGRKQAVSAPTPTPSIDRFRTIEKEI